MKKLPNVKEIVRIIEEIAPKELALPGDPVGLQCGEPDQRVKRLMIALDATPGTVRQAAAFKAELLVTHHPLLFEPLTPDTVNGSVGRTLALAIRDGLAVYSAHTNLDSSSRGINASLADLLGLGDRQTLQTVEPELFKIVVFVPGDKLDKVRSAAFEAGAGVIGNYSGCSFSMDGTGTFLPEPGTSPAVGQTGRREKVREARLEMSVGAQDLKGVLSGVRKAHPYEEPAVDVYPVLKSRHSTGLGIIGKLPRRSTVGEVASKVSSGLKAGCVRLIGRKGSPVRRVALCAGSGSSLMEKAAASGAQLFITGDMKYHDARKAEDMGLQILDVGHFAPERYGIIQFGKLLETQFAGYDLGVKVAIAKERDPFTVLL